MNRMFANTKSIALVTLIVLLAAPVAALAHKMTVDVYVASGAVIEGEAYYHAGKVAGAKVEVFAPDGKKLGETVTDEEGLFKFEAKIRCDHKFVVTDGGHRGEALLPAEDLPSHLPEYSGK